MIDEIPTMLNPPHTVIVDGRAGQPTWKVYVTRPVSLAKPPDVVAVALNVKEYVPAWVKAQNPCPWVFRGSVQSSF